MAKSFTLTLKLPQPTVRVAVEFYNDVEKEKLLKYPTSAEITDLVKSGMDIPTEEFLTYYLFHKKRPGKQGWRNYRQVGRHIGNALAELSEWIDFNGQSVSTPSNLAGQDPAITERIGESVGLSVVSKIHGLTAADWDRIPTGGWSSFDYQIASDGKDVIQMEAKGSSTVDNSRRTSSISQHKANIAEKKRAIANHESRSSYPYPASLRYGTIAVMGESLDDPVKCLLVDPPSDGDGAAAEKFRLLQRMKYLRDWVSFISPRSQFASALQTRLAALERLPDPFMLSEAPLLKGNGEPFDMTPTGGRFRRHASFFATKSKITDGPAGGVVVPLPNRDLFFLGIREVLLEQAAKQQVRRLTDYKAERGAIRKTVECVMTESAFHDLRLPSHLASDAVKYGNYFSFTLAGNIQYSDSGILFGVLPTTEGRQEELKS